MNSIELYNDHFQNYKVYQIPKAQLVIADIPYNIGKDAYGSNPMWYKGGIIKMVSLSWLERSFLIQTRISELLNICTSVLKCSSQNQKTIARVRRLAARERSQEVHRV